MSKKFKASEQPALEPVGSIQHKAFIDSVAGNIANEPTTVREQVVEDLSESETRAWFDRYGERLGGIPTEAFNEGPAVRLKRRHPDSQRFHDLLKELGELHDRKQKTYGRPDSPFANYLSSAELGIPPWQFVIGRVCEKMYRLQSFAKRGYENEEAVDRELKDIAACSMIAVVLRERAAGSPSENLGLRHPEPHANFTA